MSRRRRRKLKRWLYFPIAAVVVVAATLLFLRFSGDGAKKKAEATPTVSEVATPTPTPQRVAMRLFAYYDGTKWGYKDELGELFLDIPVQYDEARPFSEGLAFVGTTNAGVTRYSLIDSRGQLIASDLPYTEVREFSGGYAAVRTEQGWGFIDMDGQVVISPKYDTVGDCSVEKLVSGIPVQASAPSAADVLGTQDMTSPTADIPAETAGGIDAGATATPTPPIVQPGQESAPQQILESGLAMVGKNGKFGYVAPGLGDEPPAIALVYDAANDFGDRMAFVGVKQADGSIKNSIINVEASEVLSIQGQGTVFSEQMAAVRLGTDEYIYYDGTNVLTPAFPNLETGEPTAFQNARVYSQGLAPVRLEGKWGYIGKESATPVILPIYEDAMPFSENLAVVKDETGQWGAIDTSGQLVIACQYDELSSFESGYALGKKLNTYYSVSTRGVEAQLYILPEEVAASGGQRMIVTLSEGSMNVRSGPSTESDRVTVVANGTEVEVLGSEGEWTQIRMTGGITGYVKTQYLQAP